MKKILLILLVIILGVSGYFLFNYFKHKEIPRLEVQEEKIRIDKLYIYGNHLNMHGYLTDSDNYELVLYDGDFISYDIKIDDDNNEFVIADKINEGILLDNIPRGNYYMFLRSKYRDSKDKEQYKYYVIDNQTNYKETEYYTFSSVNNKITVDIDDDYTTLRVKVSANKENEIYDVVVDPGHGGMDSGASKNGLHESEYTMKIALDLKQKLEAAGVKVKLTREEGQFSRNETMPNYGENGRVSVPYKAKAKYLFSIHLNSNSSSYINGLELYTSAGVNYDFAKLLVNNIVNDAGAKYSKNTIDRVFDGIYTRTWTTSEINKSRKEYIEENIQPYDITVGTNYYFIIRETGGIMTGSYVDGRNEEIGSSPYYNSNVGTETYLLELGYLTSSSDMENIDKNMGAYTDAIVKSFMSIFNTVDKKSKD